MGKRSLLKHNGMYEKRKQADYFVTVIVDRNTGTLLYDEECDFAECVFH